MGDAKRNKLIAPVGTLPSEENNNFRVALGVMAPRIVTGVTAALALRIVNTSDGTQLPSTVRGTEPSTTAFLVASHVTSVPSCMPAQGKPYKPDDAIVQPNCVAHRE